MPDRLTHHRWIWMNCLFVSALALSGCKRGERPAERARDDPMTHLHVQLPGQTTWTQITDHDRFVRFEKLMKEVAASADIARRGVSPALVGKFYTKSKSGIERSYSLRDDGSLRYMHLEVLLNEDQYAFLTSILTSVAPGNDNDNDNGDAP